jgi:hypothetical protein
MSVRNSFMIQDSDSDVTIWRYAKHVRVHCYADENCTVDYVVNQIRVSVGKQIEHMERM